jgi:hypothetical protein
LVVVAQQVQLATAAQVRTQYFLPSLLQVAAVVVPILALAVTVVLAVAPVVTDQTTEQVQPIKVSLVVMVLDLHHSQQAVAVALE